MILKGCENLSDVALVSEAEFAGWHETVHLLRSRANARHLLQSIASADAGNTIETGLFNPV